MIQGYAWMAYKRTSARILHAVTVGGALCGRPAKYGFEDRPDFQSKCSRCVYYIRLPLAEAQAEPEGVDQDHNPAL